MKWNISPKMLFREFQGNFLHRRHTGWIDFEEIRKNEYIIELAACFTHYISIIKILITSIPSQMPPNGRN